MVNKVILIGNVGMDPEVRAMEGGVKVARIRLATTERYRDRQSNENKEHTEWHTITLWRGLADVVDNYVRKGSQIYVEGRLRTREWTDQQGNKRYTTEILADTMNLLGRRAEGGQVSDNTGTYTAHYSALYVRSAVYFCCQPFDYRPCYPICLVIISSVCGIGALDPLPQKLLALPVVFQHLRQFRKRDHLIVINRLFDSEQ